MQFILHGRHTVSPLRRKRLKGVHTINRSVRPEDFAGSTDRLRLTAASGRFKYTDASEPDFASILKVEAERILLTQQDTQISCADGI